MRQVQTRSLVRTTALSVHSGLSPESPNYFCEQMAGLLALHFADAFPPDKPGSGVGFQQTD